MTAYIDLDGTLLRCNSFTRFVRFCLANLPWSARLRVAGVATARKLRLITHACAKQRILAVVTPHLTDAEITRFAKSLRSELNDKVIKLALDADRRVLVTAAPELYAGHIAEISGLNFEAVFATPTGGIENKGSEKVRRLLEAGYTFDADTIVITDHTDDLPLIRANATGRNIIIRH